MTKNVLQGSGASYRSTTVFRTLRHAFADLLGTAALKLELLERTLSSEDPTQAAPLVERTRSIRDEIDSAARLLDLLTRLDVVFAEAKAEVSVADLCRSANVMLNHQERSDSLLNIRKRATSDALSAVASAAGQERINGEPFIASLGFENGRTVISIDAPGLADRSRTRRLLDLPRGEQDGEALFLALATAETDGGRLELIEQDGRLMARFSWPTAGPGAGA